MFSHHVTELDPGSQLPSTAKISTLHGVYTNVWPVDKEHLPPGFPDFPVLDLPQEADPNESVTFTEEGRTMPIELKYEGYWGGIWFPKEFTTWYEMRWDLAPGGAKRFIGRGGQWEG